MSHFFAYLSRMKFIKRWGLMHNTYAENVQEHSLRVAQIAHALALIRNRKFGRSVSPERVAVLALYHDAGEVLTATPPPLSSTSTPRSRRPIVTSRPPPPFGWLRWCRRSSWRITGGSSSRVPRTPSTRRCEGRGQALRLHQVPRGDGGGKQGVHQGGAGARKLGPGIDLPEVRYFLEVFIPSFRLTLDELG